MMYEVQDGNINYKCINIHDGSLSEEELAHYRSLGNNVDLLLEYLKRP